MRRLTAATVLDAAPLALVAARVCSRAVLLYDSGRFQEGPVQEVLTQANLETLHGCRLEPAGGFGRFLPAS